MIRLPIPGEIWPARATQATAEIVEVRVAEVVYRRREPGFPHVGQPWCTPLVLFLDAFAPPEHRASSAGASAAEASEAFEAAWDDYLAHLETPHGRFTSAHVDAVRSVWRRLRALSPSMPLPQVAPTEDGLLLLVWDIGEHHLEVAVGQGHKAEWLYVNRVTDAAELTEWDVATPLPSNVLHAVAAVDGPVETPFLSVDLATSAGLAYTPDPRGLDDDGARVIPPPPCCTRIGDGWCYLDAGHAPPCVVPPPRALPVSDFGRGRARR